MSHALRIGEDMYKGSGRWCCHCVCGWSYTFGRPTGGGKDTHDPWILRTESQAIVEHARHLIEVGKT